MLDCLTSTIDDIPQYYEEYTRIQLDESASTKDIDLFVFAMLYDFMSYVAQTLEVWRYTHCTSSVFGKSVTKTVRNSWHTVMIRL